MYDGTETTYMWKCDWNALKSLYVDVFFLFSDAWISFVVLKMQTFSAVLKETL